MMRVEFNRTGAERKALVTAISEILGTKAKYMGMPSTAYDFGGLIVDKTGALDFEENIFPKDIKDLLQNLADRGFTAENCEDLEENEEISEEPEEMPQIYYSRLALIKEFLEAHYGGLEPALLEKLADDWYEELYGESDEELLSEESDEESVEESSEEDEETAENEE